MPLKDTSKATRRRAIKFSLGDAVLQQTWNNGKPTFTGGSQVDRVYNSTDKSFWGTQVTTSENHPSFVRQSRRKTPVFQGDMGGAFLSQKTYVEPFQAHRTLFGADKNKDTLASVSAVYNGPMLPAPLMLRNQFPWPPYINSSGSSLDAYGATAIARCKPTNNPADLASALIELRREGLPKLIGSDMWRKRTQEIHNAKQVYGPLSNEYLSLEFGWKPLVNDIVDVAMVIDRADTLYRQYVRDSGKLVRRSYKFPTEFSEETTVVRTNVSPTLVGPSHGVLNDGTQNTGSTVRRRQTTRRCWFSGAFTYHLPRDPITQDEMSQRRSLLKKLIGLDLTPEVLWNVLPWSWAADWFVNTGDVISNLQDYSQDGLVLKYGYVMEHTVVRDTYFHVGRTGYRSSALPPEVSLVSETKQRRKATPFGFGRTWGSLTPRQLSIAAALGLSNSK